MLSLISDLPFRWIGSMPLAFPASASPAPAVTVEAVIAADPEVIVTATEGALRPGWLDDWQRWPQLRAVQRNGFVVLDGERMNRATPRMLDAVDELCAAMDKVRAAGTQRGAKNTP